MNKRNLITDYITVWSSLLLEKLMLTKLVKKKTIQYFSSQITLLFIGLFAFNDSTFL
jgi:hypothetical protein